MEHHVDSPKSAVGNREILDFKTFFCDCRDSESESISQRHAPSKPDRSRIWLAENCVIVAILDLP